VEAGGTSTFHAIAWKPLGDLLLTSAGGFSTTEEQHASTSASETGTRRTGNWPPQQFVWRRRL